MKSINILLVAMSVVLITGCQLTAQERANLRYYNNPNPYNHQQEVNREVYYCLSLSLQYYRKQKRLC